jgi:predicted metal-binding protein
MKQDVAARQIAVGERIKLKCGVCAQSGLITQPNCAAARACSATIDGGTIAV